MTKAPRGRYSQELRQQAVTMAVDDGFGVPETARRLSIPMKTLANWVTHYRQDKHEFALKPGVNEQDAELARLKKENALLRMERDILKKAAAYFAKESLCGTVTPGTRSKRLCRQPLEGQAVTPQTGPRL